MPALYSKQIPKERWPEIIDYAERNGWSKTMDWIGIRGWEAWTRFATDISGNPHLGMRFDIEASLAVAPVVPSKIVQCLAKMDAELKRLRQENLELHRQLDSVMCSELLDLCGGEK